MGGETDEHVGTSSEPVPEFAPEAEPEQAAAEPGLKHLEFLRVAIIHGTAYAVKLYNFGKENSGSFRPGVDSVEETVKTVTGPLAQKIEGKLPALLQCADKTVDDTIQYLDIVIPQSVKDRSFLALDNARDAARQAPETARTVAGQMQEHGVYTTASDYYSKIHPIAEAYVNHAWQSLSALPFAPQAIGTARVGAERINQILLNLRDSQLPLSAYVPMLPLNYLERPQEEQEQFKVR